MKRLLRYLGIAIGTLIGLAILAYGIVYFLSERIRQKTHPIPAAAIAIPTDETSIAEGRRIAITRGCVGACHGKQGEGKVMFDKPVIATLVAPNLTTAVRKYSTSELVVAIRHGLRPDGRSMMVMPSESLVALTDADLGRLIAFLKTLPQMPGTEGGVALGPLGRISVLQGKFEMVADLIARTVPPPKGTSDEAEAGRYVARTTCGGCHGPDLRGASNPSFTSPDLVVTSAYSAEAFTRLMRTGVGVGDRQLGMMATYAREHLSYLTDAEIAAMYTYLQALPPAVPSRR